jgi:hypothetical protein
LVAGGDEGALEAVHFLGNIRFEDVPSTDRGAWTVDYKDLAAANTGGDRYTPESDLALWIRLWHEAFLTQSLRVEKNIFPSNPGSTGE